MGIKILNSLTREKEELIPADGQTIKMYTCGVTVYDKCHIGHARSLCIFEVMRLYMEKYSGYGVRFVRNITDVDDKIINKGKELNKPFDEVVSDNVDAYYKDLEALNVRPADAEPRATQYIEQIIKFVQGLMEKDFAYEADGDVYFRVRRFEEYGKLSRQSIDQMLEATRIDQNSKKQDPLDFALWKKAIEGEKSWPSPWGDGRPGWHIECSCMSLTELETETIDIHAGGRDLIFPHHENEIAQSEALTGKKFANFWIHHGLLTIKHQKMAKSLGNFITLDEVLEKFPSDILKLFFLQSHYASPVDFSWEKLDEVKRSYERIHHLHDRLSKTIDGDASIKADLSENKYFKGFKTAMEDDFNTPKVLAVVFEMVTDLNKYLDETDSPDSSILVETLAALDEIMVVLGIQFSNDDDLDEALENLLKQRIQARADKDYQKSDLLRDQLKEAGIIVEDGKDGQTWRRA